MSGLMLVYLLVVVSVTTVHYNKAKQASSSSTSTQVTSPASAMGERWNKIKLERNLTDTFLANKKSGKRKEPKALNEGVVPDTLLQVDQHVKAETANIPADQHPTPDRILTAYLEPIDVAAWEETPLPVRTSTAEDLTQIKYSRLNSCRKLPQQFPIDDTPTDRDSFLPWIHDVFPTNDGKYIQFVAQNKRRCKTGRDEFDIMTFQNPQASLFQHVPINILEENGERRYKLASSHESADVVATRFICRFQPDGTETLSEFNFDYDWTAYRKRYKVSVKADDGGIKQIHSSQLLFRCPVPDHLVEKVRSGETVINDWATMFVDLVPIRTPPRFGIPNQFMQPMYKEFQSETDAFDAQKQYGDDHLLPTIENSGRWENIPICGPSTQTYPESDPAPKHKLVSCIWASAGYTTRGSRFAINDGQRRLLEWITYNKLIGFDHVYLYDNSGAFGDTSLKPIADLFPEQVTYIPWPAQVCNNRPNNVDSPGERSSQYAAEASCMLRFGPHTEWIGQFDIDEYLVPMGNYKKASDLVDDLKQQGTKIISFASWRSWPRRALIEPPVKIDDYNVCWHNEPCFDLRIPKDMTMLQAYNCDRQKPGEKQSRMPAEKQLYQPSYVLQHFVHYSAVTALSVKGRQEYEAEGFRWKGRAFPDPRQRFGDEVQEGLMVHTKAVARQDTSGWERMCHINNTKLPPRKQGLCRLGEPYPDSYTEDQVPATKDGWAFNCYVNEKVETYFVPKLEEALAQHSSILESS